jgi:hypothetical protein
MVKGEKTISRPLPSGFSVVQSVVGHHHCTLCGIELRIILPSDDIVAESNLTRMGGVDHEAVISLLMKVRGKK